MDEGAITALERAAGDGPIVVFAGAGVSMCPPTGLPGWFALNERILGAVAARVGGYFDDDRRIASQLDQLVKRRDHGAFPPDYQAQIMEEQCGLTYFRALQALDVETCNPAHGAIAALAAAGHVAAVVTTNFDCLIERALGAAGVAHRAWSTADDYVALAAAYAADGPAELPVVKVHGTVRDAASMVDTLKQRLRGRGPALTDALAHLLRRHHVLFCGFSASDLEYDPDYLGLRAAGTTSPGFTFVHLPEHTPGAGARALQAAHGDAGRFLPATLSEAFDELLRRLDVAPVPVLPPADKGPTADAGTTAHVVAARLADWSAALHPMDAVSLLATLLEATGDETTALWLLHRTWKAFRRPEHASGPEYARYMCHYGRLALAHGETGYEETPQLLLRAREEIPEATLHATRFFLATGMVELGFPQLMEAHDRGDDCSPTFAAERALLYAWMADLYGHAESSMPLLEAALERVTADGDEPRRGRLLAAGALHLARAREHERVAIACAEIDAIARRLGDDVLGARADLARGIAHYEANELDASLAVLRRAVEILLRVERLPLAITADLEAAKVAFALGRVDATQEHFMRAYEHSRSMQVYDPHVCFLRARMETLSDAYDSAREQITEGREAASSLRNAWMLQMLEEAGRLLERDAASG